MLIIVQNFHGHIYIVQNNSAQGEHYRSHYASVWLHNAPELAQANKNTRVATSPTGNAEYSAIHGSLFWLLVRRRHGTGAMFMLPASFLGHLAPQRPQQSEVDGLRKAQRLGLCMATTWGASRKGDFLRPPPLCVTMLSHPPSDSMH